MKPLETQTLHDLETPPGPARGNFAEAAADRPKIKLWPLALVSLIMVALAAVAGYLPRAKQTAALQSETRELATPTVKLVLPVRGEATPSLTLPAEVKAFVEAPIYARANGYLKRWLVDIGAQVQPGQLLAEIDTPELNQQLAQSKAELTQTEAALDLAGITAARWADLLKTASVSEQEAAEKKSDLALKSATVEASRANVRRLEELKSFALVTAPFAGTLTARNTDVGQLIVAGNGKELFRLAETRTLRVFAHVPQTMAHSIVPGVTADLMLQEMPGHIFPARVVRTSGAMDATSRTLLTELEVDNTKGDILAGSYVQVRFNDIKRDADITVPSNTLLFRSEGPQVAVVGADGQVKLHTVTLGRDFGRTLEILSGIKLTDRIILNPADSLTSGAVVRVVDSEQAGPGK